MSELIIKTITEKESLLKSEVNRLLKGVGRDAARKKMQQIIAEHRKVSDKQAKDEKSMWPPEVIKILRHYGFIE